MNTPRGYLLLEVAIGGAMVAVLAATLLTTLAGARVKNVVAGRDVIAAQLALDKIEQQRALGFANVSAASCGTESPVAGQPARYVRVCTLGASAAISLNTAPAVTVNCRSVTVTVTYDADVGANSTRTTALASQVCQ